jgi:hypothetical protein
MLYNQPPIRHCFLPTNYKCYPPPLATMASGEDMAEMEALSRNWVPETHVRGLATPCLLMANWLVGPAGE